jgi:two-component system, NtrC family, nitrogen regulation sensor histidine kinase NtrY
MKLRTKFILFVVILHLITLVLTYFIFQQNKILFIASEVLIILSMVIAAGLYRQLIRPLQLLLQGAEAITARDFNVKFVYTGKYEMDELIKVYNQMIDELRTERTKQEQQHFFLEKLIYTSPTGILILDYDNNIQEINPKALKLLNLEENEVIKKSLDDTDHPVLQEIKILKSGESKTVSFNGVNTYKLQKSHFIDRGFARHFIMIEELTIEILAAEKKAYGKVIRMMAHEVNNTIGPVNSILQSALSSKNIWVDKETQQLKNAIKVAHDRNNNLNIFMRNFADVVRLPDPVKKNIDLHAVIRSVATLMEQKTGRKKIQFEYRLPDRPFLIYADEQQMEQVLINIVKNAIEAIEEEGSIFFTTDPALRQLTIADTGRGIDDNTTDHLFSPFFSTKKDGQGIGLTLVKEILLNHGCEFSLQRVRPGETRFAIQFLI